MTARKSLAVWKFASCDGCQLSLLDCEDELLLLAGQIDIAYFPEAGPTRVEGTYDLSIVEGSITTAEDALRIREIRARSGRLITIGACAAAGGIQALRNFADGRGLHVDRLRQPRVRLHARDLHARERARPGRLRAAGLPARQGPAARGHQRLPERAPARDRDHSVCVECKRAGNVCVMVAHGTPCLGPVTHAGCGALCPSYHRGCFGCFGPMEAPNPGALGDHLGLEERDVVRLFRTFYAGAPAFGESHG